MNHNELPITDAGGVPVFDCRIILSPVEPEGLIRGRIADLDGIVAEGANERDVLRRLVDQFKQHVARCVQSSEPIPWKTPGDEPSAGESERWIPVHL